MCKAFIGKIYSYCFKKCGLGFYLLSLQSKAQQETEVILASMVFAESLVITHLIPLVTLGGSKDCKMIIGAEIFNRQYM